MSNPSRTLLAACCVTLLIVLGIYQFGPRENPTAPPLQSARPVQPQATLTAALPEETPIQTAAADAEKSGPSVVELAGFSAITAFRRWADAAAAAGFANADESKGMKLAKARSVAMKALIQADPASALRQALPADLRASLPKPIAAAIEQPVKKTGMCSMRMMCNHAPDDPHGGCETTPVLLEEIASWNAYYGEQQWRPFLGQTVGFDGIAVDEELAVRSIAPVSSPGNR